MGDPSRRRYLASVATLVTAGVAGCSVVDGTGEGPTRSGTDDRRSPTSGTESTGETPTATPEEDRTLYVDASATGAGDGRPDNPFGSIQEALQFARPGDTVHVRPGHYYENLRTVSDGEPGDPITITGPPDAVLHGAKGPGRSFGIAIRHSHVHLRGLTLDGRLGDGDPLAREERDYPSESVDSSSYALTNVDAGYHPVRYLRDLVIKPHGIGYTAGAAIDIGKAHDVEIGEFELVGPTGIQFLTGESEGHWGEVVYIGTALTTVSSMDSVHEIDESSNFHVHHVRNTAGHPHAELVEAKPGTSNVTVEYCTDLGGGGNYVLPGETDTSETAIGLRGTDSTVRWNVVENSRGKGVVVGSWAAANRDVFEERHGISLPDRIEEAGLNNAVYGNRLLDNGGLAVAFPRSGGQVSPEYGPEGQRTVCGNEYDGETHGDPDSPCPDWVPENDEIGHTGGNSPWA